MAISNIPLQLQDGGRGDASGEEGGEEGRGEEEGDSEAELTLLNQSSESILEEEQRPRLIINIM